jgi:hypothetical protein
VASDPAFEGHLTNPTSELDYFARVDASLAEPNGARGRAERLRERVSHYHVSAHWDACVRTAYSDILAVRHSPIRLPTTAALESPIDLAIREWQMSSPDEVWRPNVAYELTMGAQSARAAGEWKAASLMLMAAERLEQPSVKRRRRRTDLFVRAVASTARSLVKPAAPVVRQITADGDSHYHRS